MAWRISDKLCNLDNQKRRMDWLLTGLSGYLNLVVFLHISSSQITALVSFRLLSCWSCLWNSSTQSDHSRDVAFLTHSLRGGSWSLHPWQVSRDTLFKTQRNGCASEILALTDCCSTWGREHRQGQRPKYIYCACQSWWHCTGWKEHWPRMTRQSEPIAVFITLVYTFNPVREWKYVTLTNLSSRRLTQ